MSPLKMQEFAPSGHPLLKLQKWMRLCSSPLLLHLSSRRPGVGGRWYGKAISHIQFTYGCHGLLQAECWCHPCVGPSEATRCMGRLLTVRGERTFPWRGHYHCWSNMMNVGRHFVFMCVWTSCETCLHVGLKLCVCACVASHRHDSRHAVFITFELESKPNGG